MNDLVKATPEMVPRDPEAATEAAVSLLATKCCTVTVNRRMLFSVDPSTDEALGWREQVSYSLTLTDPAADLVGAEKVMADLMAPASDKQIARWLVEVSTITARRSDDRTDAALTLAAYTSRLREYPGDIVADTLKGWSGKWFPTWGELRAILDARTTPRASIHRLIANRIAATQPPKREETPIQKRSRLEAEAVRARVSDPARHRELQDEIDAITDEIRAARKAN